MKMSNIRPVARMRNEETGQEVNVKKGRRADRGTDHYFYTYRGERVFIADAEMSSKWKRI